MIESEAMSSSLDLAALACSCAALAADAALSATCLAASASAFAFAAAAFASSALSRAECAVESSVYFDAGDQSDAVNEPLSREAMHLRMSPSGPCTHRSPTLYGGFGCELYIEDFPSILSNTASGTACSFHTEPSQRYVVPLDVSYQRSPACFAKSAEVQEAFGSVS